MSHDEIKEMVPICPECESRDIVLIDGNTYRCIACNHLWDEVPAGE